MRQPNTTSTASDVFYGIMAYGLWGLIPLYFKTVATVPSVEVLSHRALWSFVTLLILLGIMKRQTEALACFRNGRTLLLLTLGSLLIATNWFTFIYAVLSKQVLQSSLGYFLGPLVNVVLGTLIFRERLRWMQWFSVAVASLGVLILAWKVGQIPWIALILAMTGAFHSLTRKLAPTDSLISLTIETLVAMPFGLAYLIFLAKSHTAAGNTSPLFFLLMLSGPVTTAPFLCFGRAVRHLPLTTMGIILYVMPTLQFLLAVLVFHEPFAIFQLAAFSCIWTAIAIYATDAYRTAKRNQKTPDEWIPEEPFCETQSKQTCSP